ncbi:DoxX family protein [Ammoniphilus sp. CFH 90114]|uniref:DoxX family protein n=1 Tax=Ammoniphilus sp. CFH 90114 TaxID=2493665 RepID=UPI00100FE781|nr:DoxX family protein [Ammoniphilus sp. CFH 90114]RXT07056.1 DoxX family protein [Ammoniphilus sp. CFH 90114]
MYTVGRVLMGGIFAYMGLFKILNWGATAGWMAMKGFPPSLIPVLLIGAIAIELGGGLALIFGYQLRWVAWGMTAFMIPTNIVMHNFWALPPEMAATEQLSFLQNVIIMGGLLAISTQAQNENKSSAVH